MSGYFLVRTTSMSCGPRLTAVAVGLSIVVLDDEEMKNPASVACSRECYCYIRGLDCELLRGYICIGVTMLTLIEESRDIRI